MTRVGALCVKRMMGRSIVSEENRGQVHQSFVKRMARVGALCVKRMAGKSVVGEENCGQVHQSIESKMNSR